MTGGFRPIATAAACLMLTTLGGILPSRVVAQETPSGVSADNSAESIAFVETRFDQAREGYVSLEWNEVDGARRYEVLDSGGKTVYSGGLPQAFLSGLADGTYEYSVRALSETDDVIAVSDEAAVVTVEHWPMPYVVVLFLIGLCVVLSVAVVIVRGTRSQFQTESEPQTEAQPGTKVVR